MKQMKQASIVLMMPKDFNELGLIQDIEKFLLSYPEVEISGKHIKIVEK